MAARSRTAAGARGQGVKAVLAWLEENGTQQVRDGMARYGIPSTRAFGVSVGGLRSYAKQLGHDDARAGVSFFDGSPQPCRVCARCAP